MSDVWRGPVLVTGTDTAVGKTIVTAAIAAAARDNGQRVAVVKPAQTGGDDDASEVARLAGLASVHTLSHYTAALAPAAAARVGGTSLLAAGEVVSAVADLAVSHDLVLVEGAGGLLVQIASDALTMAELAVRLQAPVVVVARPGLGTLNHTTLTLEALAARHIPACVVLGSWPKSPEIVHRTNLRDLPGRLAGAIPENAASIDAKVFQHDAGNWLAPLLHGRLNVQAFRSALSR
jgi:dethiobiotin synthetase